MADQAGSTTLVNTDGDKQIGSDVTAEGGAELIIYDTTGIGDDHVFEVFHKEKINNNLRTSDRRAVYKGVNMAWPIKYGPISVPAANAQLQFFAATDDTSSLTLHYEIREF